MGTAVDFARAARQPGRRDALVRQLERPVPGLPGLLLHPPGLPAGHAAEHQQPRLLSIQPGLSGRGDRLWDGWLVADRQEHLPPPGGQPLRRVWPARTAAAVPVLRRLAVLIQTAAESAAPGRLCPAGPGTL